MNTADECSTDRDERIRELEATLERVKQLPQKWRRYTQSLFNECDRCADELESILKGDN